jgi:glycosyltransferase involved in cell wall biosynthesis
MKLVYIISDKYNSHYGGGQIYAFNVINELVNQGVIPYIISISMVDSISKEIEIKIRDNILNEYQFGLKNKSREEATYEFNSILRKLNPDIVHAHAMKSIASESCRKFHIKCIVTAHHGGILCPQGALLRYNDEICNVRAGDKNCLPCVLKNTRGGFIFYPILKNIAYNTRIKVANLIIKINFIPFVTPILISTLSIQNKILDWVAIYKNSSLIVAPSLAIAERMIINGANPETIRVIPHGIPLPSQKYITSQPGNSINFFYIGRINKNKGLHILFEALSTINHEYTIHVFGEAITNDEKRYEKSLLKRYKNVNVIWHGNVPNNELYNSISEFDVLIHPAIFLEVFGLNISESLAIGKTVIATRCGGAEMQIQNNINGFLVPPNNVASIRSALLHLFENPYEITRLSKSRIQAISIQKHVNDLLYLYKSLLFT